MRLKESEAWRRARSIWTTRKPRAEGPSRGSFPRATFEPSHYRWRCRHSGCHCHRRCPHSPRRARLPDAAEPSTCCAPGLALTPARGSCALKLPPGLWSSTVRPRTHSGLRTLALALALTPAAAPAGPAAIHQSPRRGPAAPAAPRRKLRSRAFACRDIKPDLNPQMQGCTVGALGDGTLTERCSLTRCSTARSTGKYRPVIPGGL